MTRCSSLVAAAAVVTLAASGCGNGSTDPPQRAGTTEAAAPSADAAREVTATVRALQKAIVAGDAAASCAVLAPDLWKGLREEANATDEDACRPVATALLSLPGKFKEQAGQARNESVTVDPDGTTAKVRFRALFQGGGDEHPWQLRLRRAEERWLVDRVCALPDRGQDPSCFGSVD